MASRDRQRSRVYAWEDRVVAPHHPGMIAFAHAQGMVDAIWSELGLLYPPVVEPMPTQARCRMADANRLRIRMPAAIPSWCLLHELAHAMTTTAEGASDGHGAVFVGVYVQLLTRYLRLNGDALRLSLSAEGIAVRADARPVFCDP